MSDLLQHTHMHTVSKDEVEKLLYSYRSITAERLDRSKFRDLLHDQFSMSDDFFMDRVFRAFDKDSDGFLSQEEWVLGMSVFLRGTLEEKIKCKAIGSVQLPSFVWTSRLRL